MNVLIAVSLENKKSELLVKAGYWSEHFVRGFWFVPRDNPDERQGPDER